MSLESFIKKITTHSPVDFNETMTVIAENFDYQPTEFCNGLAEDLLINPASTNEGSCKIFAFARIQQLTQQQTLNLFGDYYRVDVLNNPEGISHRNIRNFMRYGWEGISFIGEPLIAK
jgi:hypothetical protein